MDCSPPVSVAYQVSIDTRLIFFIVWLCKKKIGQTTILRYSLPLRLND